jgi:glycosyltransferase involved in cell wall biosynthesis
VKILFPIGSFYPAQSGGPSNTIYWLAKALKRNGVEPIVITTDKDIDSESMPINQFIKTEAGKIIYCHEKNYKIPVNMIKKSIKNINRVDIIHLTSLFFPPSFIIALFSRISNKKVIWSVRGELEPGALKFKTIYKKIYLFFIKNIIINSNFVFHSTSKKETENIKKILGNVNIVELPNFIELPKKYEEELENQILFLGRLHPIKNIDTLIKSLLISKKFNKKNFILKIAGKGNKSYVNYLKQLVIELDLEKKVKFLGEIKGEEKYKLIAQSYLLVLPSFSENFGNVVLEGLSQGVPIIASKGTPWDILETSKAGKWVDNDSIALSKAIDFILSLNQQEYCEYKKNACYLSKEFEINKKVQEWIKIYRSLK